MRKVLVSILFLVVALANGQQLQSFSSYVVNPMIFNPAVAGNDSITDVFLLYRKQFTGIAGTPETQFGSIEGQLLEDKMGIGGVVYNDMTNIFGRTGVFLNVSYKIPIDSSQYVRAGLGIGVVQNRVHFDKIVAQSTTESTLFRVGQSGSKPDASFGVYYSRHDKLDVSFSALQLFNSTYTYINQAEDDLAKFMLLKHFYLSGGYKIEINHPDWKFRPFTQIRSVQSLAPQIDIGVQTFWKDRVWASLMYRTSGGFNFMAGGEINDRISMVYAFETPLNGIGKYAGGSHELGMNIRLFGSKHAGGGSAQALQMQEQLVANDEKLLHDVDSLNQHVEIIHEQVEENTVNLEVAEDELLKILEELERDRDQTEDFVHDETVDVQKVDSLDNKGYDYYVVVGTYTEYNYAKFIQNVLKRDYYEESTVTASTNKEYYLVWTKQVFTKKEARTEITRLNGLIDMKFFGGGAWLYHKRKE